MEILICFAIFFAKVLEVSIMTVRNVLLARGEKFWASFISIAEVVIWVYLVASIIDSVKNDPLKLLFYSMGFACGNYLGSMIEEKLALGLITLNIISGPEEGDAIASLLREQQVGVTVIDGEGRLESKKILMVHLKRRRKNEIVKLLEESNFNCVISVNDTKVVYGGYGLRK